MGKVIKLTESQLRKVVKRMVLEMGDKKDLQELIPLLADSRQVLDDVISLVDEFSEGSTKATNMTFKELYDSLQDVVESLDDDRETQDRAKQVLSTFSYFVDKQSDEESFTQDEY